MSHAAAELAGASLDLSNLTICYPTFDRAKFITASIDQLANQEVDKLKVLIVDSGSKDGTPELIQAQIKHGWWKPPCFAVELDMRIVQLPEIRGKANGVVAAMQTFQKEVTTEFMMRIEPDILIPPNALKPMMQMFRDMPDLGMLAIGYRPTKSHVPTDCTIFRTEDVRAVVWQWDSAGCDCVHAANQLRGLGKQAMFHPSLCSRHLRFL